MTDRFTHRLSEFRDGELSPSDEGIVRRHIETCRECADTLADLERVVERAARLSERRLERDLWPGILSRMTVGSERSGTEEGPAAGAAERTVFRRRFTFSVPQLAAAAITLAAVSAGGAWMVAGPRSAPTGPTPANLTTADGSMLASGGGNAGSAARMAEDITNLEQTLFDPAHPLPPETATAIRRSLVKIDRAIEDARAALRQLPEDAYLRQHMNDTMRRKEEFLRRAMQLSQS